MFYVDGLPILASEYTILSILKQQVYDETGKLYFSKIRPRGSEIQVCCPYHKDGMEKRPSATISTSDKRDDRGRLIKAGTFHCFACGETADLPTMISHCFGFDNDFGVYGRKWLLENFTRASEIEMEGLDDLPSPFRGKNSAEGESISEEVLDSYRVYHDYMFQRGLTEELIEIFDVGFDPDFKLTNSQGKEYSVPSLTFPVRDKNGKVLFIARRSVAGKIFHYPPQAVKPLYGIYELYKYWDIGPDESGHNRILPELYVVESIFNCITCWKYHVPAVALLGTGTPNQIKLLERLPVAKYILGHDPDPAGDKGIERFIRLCNKTNIEIMDIPGGKDINDLSESEFWEVERFKADKFSL